MSELRCVEKKAETCCLVFSVCPEHRYRSYPREGSDHLGTELSPLKASCSLGCAEGHFGTFFMGQNNGT